MVATHLASRGAPTIRPTANVDAGPYVENGCAMTLWELSVGRAVETEADATMTAKALQQVHHALCGFDRDLPSFIGAVETCETILANPGESPKLRASDRLFLERLYARLRQELDNRDLACRPIHGDTHLANVLITESGAVWMDLEAVCLGPLEWDVITLPRIARSQFKGVDANLMRFLADVRSLCVATWCWADYDRSTDIREAAIHHLDALKTRFGCA